MKITRWVIGDKAIRHFIPEPVEERLNVKPSPYEDDMRFFTSKEEAEKYLTDWLNTGKALRCKVPCKLEVIEARIEIL